MGFEAICGIEGGDERTSFWLIKSNWVASSCIGNSLN
jgi:hypothetical protein